MTIRAELLRRVNIGTLADVTAKAISTLNLPKAGTIHAIGLEVTDSSGDAVPVATMKTELAHLTLVLGGKKIIDEISITEAFMMEQFFGAKNDVANAAGVVLYPTTLVDAVNPSQAQQFALGTSLGLNSQGEHIRPSNLYVTVKMGSSVSSTAQVQVFAMVEDRESSPVPCVILNRLELQAASTGYSPIRELPYNDPNAMIRTMWIEESGTKVVSKFKLKDGKGDILEECLSSTYDQLLAYKGLTQQSGYHGISFNKYNGIYDGLDLGASVLELNPYWAGAAARGQFDLIMQKIVSKL